MSLKNYTKCQYFFFAILLILFFGLIKTKVWINWIELICSSICRLLFLRFSSRQKFQVGRGLKNSLSFRILLNLARHLSFSTNDTSAESQRPSIFFQQYIYYPQTWLDRLLLSETIKYWHNKPLVFPTSKIIISHSLPTSCIYNIFIVFTQQHTFSFGMNIILENWQAGAHVCCCVDGQRAQTRW